ncbi:MAG: TIGR01212 family radical SAM protein [Spirochaetales bacterium]|nr:TIGR01212 family radical SAM protein [Spirochaetales bacterium]MCF7938457.1 TIGR01212 family radical SAM protein [Spirochaetales bacterium]
MSERFTSYSRYLRDRYGERAWRVGVDAGFSCPNRKGRSGAGCSYCEVSGSRAPYLKDHQELEQQVEKAVAFLRSRYEARIFLLYFQAYTNTLAAPRQLRELYDYTLSLADFRELIISTRPDCIDEEKADLIASYRRPGFDVWVELGLQTAQDDTLERINRGHDYGSFLRAFELLRKRGVKIAVHLIFGLPGEGGREILDTVGRVASLSPEGVKIHNLHIPKSSPLFEEYLQGEISVPSSKRHIQYVAQALELLSEKTVIMRLTTDTADDRLGAPLRQYPKQRVYQEVEKLLKARDTRQGASFSRLVGGDYAYQRW